MGEIAQRYSDLAILTSDNPRTEDPTIIIEEVVAGATALIGGILAGGGVLFITWDLGLAVGVGIMIFVFGALVQIFLLRKHRMRRR